jgi:hypothetical protein
VVRLYYRCTMGTGEVEGYRVSGVVEVNTGVQM